MSVVMGRTRLAKMMLMDDMLEPGARAEIQVILGFCIGIIRCENPALGRDDSRILTGDGI